MSTVYDDLRKAIAQLADAPTKAERAKLRTSAMLLVLKAETARPASEEALSVAYEAGARKALEIYRAAHEEKEEPIRTAKIGDAYSVLDGLLLFAQSLRYAAEHALVQHLTARMRPPSSPESVPTEAPRITWVSDPKSSPRR